MLCKHIQAEVEWMEQHDIIRKLLRANLHQRQYVQQVTCWAACQQHKQLQPCFCMCMCSCITITTASIPGYHVCIVGYVLVCVAMCWFV